MDTSVLGSVLPVSIIEGVVTVWPSDGDIESIVIDVGDVAEFVGTLLLLLVLLLVVSKFLDLTLPEILYKKKAPPKTTIIATAAIINLFISIFCNIFKLCQYQFNFLSKFN